MTCVKQTEFLTQLNFTLSPLKQINCVLRYIC